MKTTDSDVVQTNGQIFPDGTVIELMRNATNQTVLLLWKDEYFEMADRVEYSGATYAAAPIAPNILRALHLPAQLERQKRRKHYLRTYMISSLAAQASSTPPSSR